MYRMQGVEPASGLVHSLGDEVRSTAEIGTVPASEPCLCIRHRSGVEPHVYEVGLPGHLAPARAHEEDIVHVRTVEVYPVVILLAHIIRVEALVPERIGLHKSGFYSFVDLIVELPHRTYADFFPAVIAAPYRERCSPIAAAAEVPVLDVFQPLAESSAAGGFRLPFYAVVELHHLLAHCGGAYKPAVERVVEHRFVGTPAVRIAVHVLFDTEHLACGLHHHAEIHVKRSCIGREAVVVCVLHIPAGPLGIIRANPILHVLRIQVLDAVEPALRVHLGLRIAVDVFHEQTRHPCCLGNLGVIGTEGRRYVHDARSFFGGHVIPGNHPECALVRTEPGDELLVAHSHEFAALHYPRKHFECCFPVE